MNDNLINEKLKAVSRLVKTLTDLNKPHAVEAIDIQIQDIRKQLELYDVVESKNKHETQQARHALKAITAWRQLDGLNLLSIEQKTVIKGKIMAVYKQHLSPIRIDQ